MRSFFIVSAFLTAAGIASSVSAQVHVGGTSFGGYEVSPGIRIGGVTVTSDGRTIVGGVTTGGVPFAGADIGTLTLGGMDLSAAQRRRSEASGYGRNGNFAEDDGGKLTIPPADVRPARPKSPTRAEKKRENLAQLKAGTSYLQVEVMFVDANCAGKSLNTCLREAEEMGAFAASVELPLIGLLPSIGLRMRKLDQQDLTNHLNLYDRFVHVVNEHDEGGAGRRITSDEIAANVNAFLNIMTSRPLASAEIMTSLARECGIENLLTKAQLIFTSDRLYDAYEFVDDSIVSIGKSRILGRFASAGKSRFQKERGSFGIENLMGTSLPGALRSGLSQNGYCESR